MILFEAQIAEHQQLAEHYRELAAKREALAHTLLVVQQQVDSDLSSLKLLVDKCKEVAPGAIASLKSAILELFGTDDGNDGGNKPTEPAPDDPTPRAEQPQTYNSSDAEELETVCVGLPRSFAPGSTLADENGSLGIVIGINNVGMSIDWLGLGSCPNPASGKGVWYDWAKDNHALASLKPASHDQVKLLSTSEFLQLQSWQSDQLDQHWDNVWFDVGVGCQCKWGGAAINRWIVVFSESCEWTCPLASHLASALWEDAPLLGQHCIVTFEHNGNKSTSKDEQMPYMELVRHPENGAIAYQCKHDGEIICVYIGFHRKNVAQSWMHFLEAITSRVELRQAKRMEGFKWEIKAKGLSMAQINRLATEDLNKSYRPEIGSTKPPSYNPQPKPEPVNPDEVQPGDIVTPLLTPGDSYEVLQVMPNGILDCKSLRTGVQMGMRPTAVSLVQKAQLTT
jgi:hypothetical protein